MANSVAIVAPRPRRLWRIVMRNGAVWRKLLWPSVMTHILDPVVFLFGMGLGVGALVGEIDGASYSAFLAAGMVAYGAMNSASFEALYSAYTRMRVQRTWESILNTPVTLPDIIAGEWLWAGAKGVFSSLAVLAVLVALGICAPAAAVAALPVAALTALCFAGIALPLTAFAPGYDFFSYYFSLFITPSMMLSGVFFPVSVLPAALQAASSFLPLTHAVALLRPITRGDFPPDFWLHAAALTIPAIGGLVLSTYLFNRRLLR